MSISIGFFLIDVILSTVHLVSSPAEARVFRLFLLQVRLSANAVDLPSLIAQTPFTQWTFFTHLASRPLWIIPFHGTLFSWEDEV